jgi:hypothetical protein
MTDDQPIVVGDVWTHPGDLRPWTVVDVDGMCVVLRCRPKLDLRLHTTVCASELRSHWMRVVQVTHGEGGTHG